MRSFLEKRLLQSHETSLESKEFNLAIKIKKSELFLNLSAGFLLNIILKYACNISLTDALTIHDTMSH